nr:MarC family protein [Ardenticatena sp.]
MDTMLPLSEYVKLFAGLMAVVSIPGNLPVFLAFTRDLSPAERDRVALLAALTVAIAMLAFNFFGTLILDMFGISIDSFRIAGGILLLMTGLAMMNAGGEPVEPTTNPADRVSVGIVPLGIPLLSGPGAMSTVIVYANTLNTPTHRLAVACVIILLASLIFITFRLAHRAGMVLGPTSMQVFNRVMGLILSAIAVEFMMSGIGAYFPGLRG